MKDSSFGEVDFDRTSILNRDFNRVDLSYESYSLK